MIIKVLDALGNLVVIETSDAKLISTITTAITARINNDQLVQVVD